MVIGIEERIMKQRFIDIKSVSELHRFYDIDKPKHPLVTVIDYTDVKPDRKNEDALYRTGFYMVMCKRIEGTMMYGKTHYDFEEGTLMFAAPNQVLSAGVETKIIEGWALCFDPLLLSGCTLGEKMHDYSFFRYDVNEALHISDDEKKTLEDCLSKIKKEYEQNIDKHTRNLIVDNLQLLLNYCNRFYDRQFISRSRVNKDVVQRFEKYLDEYFLQIPLIEKGLPDVKYFASRLNLSPNYLSDLLHKYTGKTTQEYIHLRLLDKAKQMLWGTEKSISEIAYDLGFGHTSHFTKLFKAKTGRTPKEFRNMN